MTALQCRKSRELFWRARFGTRLWQRPCRDSQKKVSQNQRQRLRPRRQLPDFDSALTEKQPQFYLGCFLLYFEPLVYFHRHHYIDKVLVVSWF